MSNAEQVVTLSLDEWKALSAAVAIAADCARFQCAPLPDGAVGDGEAVVTQVHRRRAEQQRAQK